MHDDFDFGNSSRDGQTEELLDDLELRCTTNVAAVRESAWQHKRVRVEIRAGDACLRTGLLTELFTNELSPVGLVGIAPMPLMVGSVFHLQFERHSLDAPSTLAICDRCAMLGDSSFELRFRFTQAIDVDPADPGS